MLCNRLLANDCSHILRLLGQSRKCHAIQMFFQNLASDASLSNFNVFSTIRACVILGFLSNASFVRGWVRLGMSHVGRARLGSGRARPGQIGRVQVWRWLGLGRPRRAQDGRGPRGPGSSTTWKRQAHSEVHIVCTRDLSFSLFV